jgi:hypothetical protein
MTRRRYARDEAFNPAKVERASKAAAPLCSWTLAQLRYAEALAQAKPLKKELAGGCTHARPAHARASAQVALPRPAPNDMAADGWWWWWGARTALESALAAKRRAYDDAMALVQLGSEEGIAGMEAELGAVVASLETLAGQAAALEVREQDAKAAVSVALQEEGSRGRSLGTLRSRSSLEAELRELTRSESPGQQARGAQKSSNCAVASFLTEIYLCGVCSCHKD